MHEYYGISLGMAKGMFVDGTEVRFRYAVCHWRLRFDMAPSYESGACRERCTDQNHVLAWMSHERFGTTRIAGTIRRHARVYDEQE